MLAYRERGAGAVLHTHSPHAVRVTLLYDKEFVITHQEMIKVYYRGINICHILTDNTRYYELYCYMRRVGIRLYMTK